MNEKKARELKETALDLSIERYEIVSNSIFWFLDEDNNLFKKEHLPILERIAGEKFSVLKINGNCACCAVSYFLTERYDCEECIIEKGMYCGIAEKSEKKAGCLKNCYLPAFNGNQFERNHFSNKRFSNKQFENILQDLRNIRQWYYNEKGENNG